MYRYALYLSGDAEKAQEFCQEAFLRWFDGQHPERVLNPTAWLKTVLANLVYSDYRHGKNRSDRELCLNETYLQIPDSVNSDLLRLEVEDVLQRLPWKDQILIKLRMSGMSYKEIAEALNLPIGSVGTLLSRAMRKFRLEYEGKEEPTYDKMLGRRQNVKVFGE